jgi:HK97 family phage prohead protease
MEFETRYLRGQRLEVRDLPNGQRQLGGYALRFAEDSENLGGFVESIDPNVEISGADVRHLVNHDANLVLGRTTAGTTRLTRDAEGQRVETDMPDTSYARDLAVSVERRDIDQMSFGFRVVPRSNGEPGDSWDFSTTPARRTLHAIELHDVSTVTYPAYPTTTAEVRSLLGENGIEVPEAPEPEAAEVDERAGKALSAANAEHVTAASDALATAAEHITHLADAAGLGEPEADVAEGVSEANAADLTDAELRVYAARADFNIDETTTG